MRLRVPLLAHPADRAGFRARDAHDHALLLVRVLRDLRTGRGDRRMEARDAAPNLGGNSTPLQNSAARSAYVHVALRRLLQLRKNCALAANDLPGELGQHVERVLVLQLPFISRPKS